MTAMSKQGIGENVELCTTLRPGTEEIKEPTARRTRGAANPADRLHR